MISWWNVFGTCHIDIMVKILFISSCLFLCSCQTITFFPSGKKSMVLSSEPDYQKSQHFFLGGLVKPAEVDATQICDSREVLQMQTQITYLDMIWPLLIGVATGIALGVPFSNFDGELIGGLLGFLIGINIYQPKTAKIWCAPEGTSL